MDVRLFDIGLFGEVRVFSPWLSLRLFIFSVSFGRKNAYACPVFGSTEWVFIRFLSSLFGEVRVFGPRLSVWLKEKGTETRCIRLVLKIGGWFVRMRILGYACFPWQ